MKGKTVLMETYLGVKLIQARPMKRGEYNDYRGWTMPALFIPVSGIFGRFRGRRVEHQLHPLARLLDPHQSAAIAAFLKSGPASIAALATRA